MSNDEASDVLALLEEKYAGEIRLTERQMLGKIPREGGLFTRKYLRKLTKTAFIAGVLSATDNNKLRKN